MLEASLSLGSFVCPIPICQPEADLDSILKIFQNIRCKSLAIPLSQTSWGIVNSEDLLSLISRRLSSKQMVLVGHPKNGLYQPDIHQLTIRNLNSLIEPAIVYQADTEIGELIGAFEPDSWFSDRLEYLVVDRMGKLRGKLDCNKILRYLATKTRQCATNNSEPLLTNWSNLLASFSHELKSPLTGIAGLSNLLQAERIGKLNQRQARYVNLIQNGSRQANAIIGDLLTVTNLVKQRLPLETVNLELLCHQVHQQVSNEIQSSDTWESNSTIDTKPNLEIEPNSKIATVNRAVLSGVLYYLAIEIFKTVNSLPSKFKIGNLQGLTVIEISGKARELNFLPPEYTDSASANSSYSLAIARYLAEVIAGSINITYAKNYCQFTLRLPHSIPDGRPERYTEVGAQVKIHRPQTAGKSKTILCLYPELAASDTQIPLQNDTLALKNWINGSNCQDERHRIIEADSLEQAHTLARIWQLDVVILEGYRIADPVAYLRSLLESKYLSALPLVTLDAITTEAANQLSGLNVYPCLLPSQQRSFTELMQVIKIATGE